MMNSRQREEKQQRRNQIIIGIFMVVLLVGSTVGYFVANDNSGSDGGLEFEAKDGKTYSFQAYGGKYYTDINKRQFFFYSHPSEASEMNVSDGVFELIKNAQVAGLSFNPESEDIQFIELARLDMTNDFAYQNKYLISGIQKNSTLYQFPIITCANSTYSAPVIEFRESNNTIAYSEGSCIIVEGRKFDFLQFRDYILYKNYGLI